MIKFESFGADDTARYREYYQKCAQMTADVSPVIILGWRLIGEVCDNAEVLRGYAEGLCWHCVNEVDNGQYWLTPVGDWEAVDWKRIFAEHVPAGTRFFFVPERLMQLWQEALGTQIEVEETRNYWDYIISAERLYDMSGHALKHFRNERNAFEKAYQYTVEDFSPAIFDELKEFHLRAQEDIISRTEEKKTADYFEGALPFVLDSWEEYKEAFQHLYGFVIKVDGKCVAYSINEQVSDSYAIGIFAAADYDYKGVNKLAYWVDAKRNLERGIKLENAMDDTGSLSLRNFKERLCPVEMLKKYRVTYLGSDESPKRPTGESPTDHE